jgi:hypothetical protein
MDSRLDYAPPPRRNLRRHLLAFLVGYLVATVLCWMLLLTVLADQSALPMVILMAPLYLLMKIPGLFSEKVALFLILVVGPALWGLYASILTAPTRVRTRCIILAISFHAACFALLAVV